MVEGFGLAAWIPFFFACVSFTVDLRCPTNCLGLRVLVCSINGEGLSNQLVIVVQVTCSLLHTTGAATTTYRESYGTQDSFLVVHEHFLTK